MAKTKKHAKRSKSRRLRRGGRKSNNMALQMTQMIGGQVPPAPAPAPRILLGNYDEQSVKDSLQSFGDAVTTLKSAIDQGVFTSISLESAVKEQKAALLSLQTSAGTLVGSVTDNTTDSSGKARGLFKRLVGSNFVPTAEPPAPAPRPA